MHRNHIRKPPKHLPFAPDTCRCVSNTSDPRWKVFLSSFLSLNYILLPSSLLSVSRFQSISVEQMTALALFTAVSLKEYFFYYYFCFGLVKRSISIKLRKSHLWPVAHGIKILALCISPALLHFNKSQTWLSHRGLWKKLVRCSQLWLHSCTVPILNIFYPLHLKCRAFFIYLFFPLFGMQDWVTI